MPSTDTVVVGGSQAGLTTSYHLNQQGIEHVILDENNEVGAAWRNRWESLRLFTPGKFNSLPGMPFSGEPWSYPGKDAIADYLQEYAREFGLPVRTGVKVHKVGANGGRYLLESTDGPISADNVVVATGAFHHPRIPDFAGALDPNIVQLHSTEYRGPSQVPDGPVLVVGAGQAGAEIALDMAEDHQVWLSGRDTGEQPFTRGSRLSRILSPLIAFVTNNVINVANPIGRKARDAFLYPPKGLIRAGGTKKQLAEAGVEWAPKTAGTSAGYPVLEDDRVLDVKSVIWCTGHAPDYSWIDFPVFDDYGYPIHERGVVESHPGLYFMGLLFQRSVSSGLIMGMGRDAEYVAEHIAHRQPARQATGHVH